MNFKCELIDANSKLGLDRKRFHAIYEVLMFFKSKSDLQKIKQIGLSECLEYGSITLPSDSEEHEWSPLIALQKLKNV